MRREREIRRGIPFPHSPYGHDLPLPSQDGRSELVDNAMTDLQVLWLLIRKERNHGDDIKAGVINRFFDSLSLEQNQWFEDYDSKSGRRRAVMIKERAIQLAQKNDWLMIEDKKNQAAVIKFLGWIEEEKVK